MRVALALLAATAVLPAAPEGAGVDLSLEGGRVGGIGPETRLGGGAHWTLRGNLAWEAYCGAGALRGGRLTAFRVSTGQRLCGASATLGLGEAWTVGTRFLRLDGEPRNRRGVWNAPLPVRFRTATSAAAWAAYRSDGLRLFFEGAAAGSKPVDPQNGIGRPFHGTAVAEWSRSRAGAILVAESQGADYMPVAGAYLGDRATGRSSVRARPLPVLEIGLSASATRNNVEQDHTRSTRSR